MTYFPTRAIFKVLLLDLIRSTISVHSFKSIGLVTKPNSLQTTSEKWAFSSIKGASYKHFKVLFSITHSSLTLQNIAIFLKMFCSRGSSHLKTMIFGFIPKPNNSFTECWVGFDLCSSDPLKYGTKQTWINKLLFLPTSKDTCLIASINGWDSISPIVPPISVITTSAFVFLPTR